MFNASPPPPPPLLLIDICVCTFPSQRIISDAQVVGRLGARFRQFAADSVNATHVN
jgi:hypothetical protein